MNEAEAAKIFNEELDALLAGRRPSGAPADPGALALAAELARADFSRESLIKDSLRARLLGRPAGPFAALRRALGARAAGAAFAAAALLLALVPLLRRSEAPGPRPAEAPPAALSAGLPPPPAVRARKPASSAPGAGALFASLPAAGLAPLPIKEFPITAAASGLPMALRPARGGGAAPAPEGPALQTVPAAFPIETRPAAPEGIFESRTL